MEKIKHLKKKLKYGGFNLQTIRNSYNKSFYDFNIKKAIYILNLLIIFLFYIFISRKYTKRDKNNFYEFSISRNYKNLNFAIIVRNCEFCGLFSFYIVYLGCIHKYLLEGYIPIIDIKSLPNVINGFNTSKNNLWELFFEQPYGFTLEEVLKNAKNITYIQCDDCFPRPDENSMIDNLPRRHFWNSFANKYLSIKKELIDLSNQIMNKLFKGSKNILGVLTRGTDYISRKPKDHPIPPDILDLIRDVKEMDNKNKYDYIFFSTEDDIIRDNFTKIFSNKIKIIKPKFKINYDYIKGDFINNNEKIIGNIDFNKIYLLNIIILSKCLDIIAARCSGTVGIFVLSEGFRNKKIYDLGKY